ncbi:MAG: hypothetical protein II453_10045 [Alphaproteobacteria bacterium]|nr:hypothetical protein [Alphaproteobacteria bacterium]MBQ3946338.1 hypothetical protein [Alphaproteobacteria bacterium]
MKVIRVCTANNPTNTFYKIMRPLQYYRIPAKYLLNEGIADIKPYNNDTMQAIKKALNELKVKFTEVEE